MPKLTLELDELDYTVIQAEIAHRQQRARFSDGGVVMPEGQSCIAGALIAEAIRDLDEYRRIFDDGPNFFHLSKKSLCPRCQKEMHD